MAFMMTAVLPFSLFRVKNQQEHAAATTNCPMAIIKALFHKNTKKETANLQSKMYLGGAHLQQA
jgi:hypothetical protein